MAGLSGLSGLGGASGIFGGAFTPASISGLQAWFESYDASTITIGTGVSQWNDKSGNGRHLTQATGLSQPTYTASGLPNGGYSIVFDGVADYMSTAAFTRNQAHTLYLAMKVTSRVIGESISDGIAALNTARYYLENADNAATSYAGVGFTNAGPGTGVWCVMQIVFNGASSKLRKNKGTQNTGNAGSSNASGLRVGAYGGGVPGSFYDGALAAVLCYNTAHTTTEGDLIADYIAAQTGISV